ncbi:hypothetical protein [Phytohabitans rumicis]|uniref:hypothetical protein n=1 Tax=Phytohabitans rumicis TaxID=1076125 RepID=UPI0031F13BF2
MATRSRLLRGVLTVAGIIGGLFCYFVCQGMFAGYPRYHSGLLSLAGMILLAVTGGAAWIIDEHRIRDDG